MAGLIISRFGKMGLGAVAARLQQTADPQACPTTLPTTPSYLAVLGVHSGAVQSCQGGAGYNSWYGNGR